MQFFMVTKGHKKYGLELREENTCTKILQSEIKTWLYLRALSLITFHSEYTAVKQHLHGK